MTTGARPLGTEGGAADEATSSQAVKRMFDSIAPRYDLLNRVLSANIAPVWWQRTARAFADILRQPQACVVDLCCGTGSLTLELEKLRPADSAPVLAIDFSHAMLALGKPRFHHALAIEANAMQLPLADNSVDLITTAFGFRNLPNYDAALRELHRVLKPGATLAILEANEPDGFFAPFYRLYFHHVVPRIGSLLSSRSAYAYLPASVARFPSPPRLLAMARAAGFTVAAWAPYSFGIAGLYSCRKSSDTK